MKYVRGRKKIIAIATNSVLIIMVTFAWLGATCADIKAELSVGLVGGDGNLISERDASGELHIYDTEEWGKIQAIGNALQNGEAALTPDGVVYGDFSGAPSNTPPFNC